MAQIATVAMAQLPPHATLIVTVTVIITVLVIMCVRMIVRVCMSIHVTVMVHVLVMVIVTMTHDTYVCSVSTYSQERAYVVRESVRARELLRVRTFERRSVQSHLCTYSKSDILLRRSPIDPPT